MNAEGTTNVNLGESRGKTPEGIRNGSNMQKMKASLGYNDSIVSSGT